MMKKITVFTPTYNRAHLLPKLYASLCRQTSQNFHWLIIDDGSVDDTRHLVNEWKKEGKVEIKYYYQENKGKLAALIHALEYIDTLLFTCIDSDDYMPLNAVERIIALWKKRSTAKTSGIIGLDAYEDGQIAGSTLPDVDESTYSQLIDYYKIRGDKKYIFNTEIYRKYLPYPFFDDEKFHEVSWIFPLIDQDYKFLISNEVYCIIEYQSDGLSNGLFNRYKNNPKSFSEYRKVRIKYGIDTKVRFKNAIHYVSSNIFSGNWNLVKESPNKCLTFLALPFGVILNAYINYKIKQDKSRIKKGKLK